MERYRIEKLANKAFRIFEKVTSDGLEIHWPGLYASSESAQNEIDRAEKKHKGRE